MGQARRVGQGRLMGKKGAGSPRFRRRWGQSLPGICHRQISRKSVKCQRPNIHAGHFLQLLFMGVWVVSRMCFKVGW